MGDAAAGGHQIDRAGLDPLVGAEAVAMVDGAGEQIGDRRQVDVRVRAHVDAAADLQLRRAHLVEEDERPDHRPLLVRQRPVDLEPAEVVGDRRQRLQDRAIHLRPRAAVGVRKRNKARPGRERANRISKAISSAHGRA